MVKKVKYPIKYKFMLFISILIALSVFSLGYILINLQEKSLTDEMLKRGGFLVRALSRIALENYVTDDMFPIIVYCANLSKEEGVEEAFFLTKEGYVVAHSDTSKITPLPEKRAIRKKRGKKKKKEEEISMFPPSQEYNKPFFHKGKNLNEDEFGYQLYKNGECYDIYSPVRYKDKIFGTAHIIFSRSIIFKMINEAKRRIVYVSIIVLLCGLLGSLFLSLIVVKPVKKLAEGVSIIGTGNLDYKISLKSSDELGYLAEEFNEMTVKLKEAQKVLIEKQKMEKEMQIASSIQQMLLPKIYPKFSNLVYGAFYQATKEVGGDYYDFIRISDTKLGMIVADVSGKGVPGSLIMSMFRSIIRTNISPKLDSYETLCRTNAIIYPDIREGMFITVFYGIFDLASNILDFSIAGHEPLIIINSDNNKFNLYYADGIPVGIDNNENFRNILKSNQIKISKNDLIIQYTDGVTEAMNSKRELFGEERFYSSVKNNGKLLPEEFIKAVRQDILNFTEGAPQSDDITIVAVKMIEEEFIKTEEEVPLAISAGT